MFFLFIIAWSMEKMIGILEIPKLNANLQLSPAVRLISCFSLLFCRMQRGSMTWDQFISDHSVMTMAVYCYLLLIV